MLHALSAALALVAGGALALGAYQWARDAETATAPGSAAAPKPPGTIPTAGDPPPGSVPAATLSSTLAWPADVPRERSRDMAYAVLFRAWGAAYDSGNDACRRADSEGLRCLTANGRLDELREMNRPAVLRMRDEHGREFFATLTRLDDTIATVVVGTDTKSVAVRTLVSNWSGHYTVLWRMPPQAREYVQVGEKGEAVAWLNRQLPPEPGGTAQAAGDPVFDDALVRRVKRFQAAQGLMADGVVGPRTLMRLSLLSDRSAPQLAVERAGK